MYEILAEMQMVFRLLEPKRSSVHATVISYTHPNEG